MWKSIKNQTTQQIVKHRSNNMKKLIIITAAVAIGFAARAQQPTVESGIKLYNYKNYVSAQRVLLPFSVKDARANYYLGLSYLESGNPAKANVQFQKYPEDPANIAGTARVAFAMKDAAKGNQIVKDLAAKAKKKEYLQLLYAAEALTYSEGTDLQQAIQWYKDALTRNPNDPEIHLGLGDTYRKVSGGGGESMSNYESITDKDTKNSLVLTRIGDLWYDARNYTSALDFYSKAKDADSTNPLPYKSLALAYQRTGKYDVSLSNIRKYISLSDNTVTDQISFAGILYQAKSYCEAAKLANDLLKQQPPEEKKVELYGILGFSQAECGDSLEAVKNLRQYFGMQKAKNITPAAYVEYGKLWLKLNNIDSASAYYNKGIAADTSANKTDVYRQIAEAYRMKKEYCKSGEWYANLVQIQPATQALDYFWGTVMYYYCKDWKNALSMAEKFETKYDDQASSTYWHARVQSAIDSEATSGLAAASFEKWLNKLGTDVTKPEKKSDVVRAYQYLLFYNYNAKDKEKTKVYMDKLRAVDANDGLIKQIEDMEKGGGAPRKTPATPKAPTTPKAPKKTK